MKRIAILLAALAVLSGAIFSPNEVRADVVRLECGKLRGPNDTPLNFTIWLKKDWSSYEYVYSEASRHARDRRQNRFGQKQLVEFTGSVEDHGHKQSSGARMGWSRRDYRKTRIRAE